MTQHSSAGAGRCKSILHAPFTGQKDTDMPFSARRLSHWTKKDGLRPLSKCHNPLNIFECVAGDPSPPDKKYYSQVSKIDKGYQKKFFRPFQHKKAVNRQSAEFMTKNVKSLLLGEGGKNL